MPLDPKATAQAQAQSAYQQQQVDAKLDPDFPYLKVSIDPFFFKLTHVTEPQQDSGLPPTWVSPPPMT